MSDTMLVELYGGPFDGARNVIPAEAREVIVAMQTEVVDFWKGVVAGALSTVRRAIYRKSNHGKQSVDGWIARFDFEGIVP